MLGYESVPQWQVWLQDRMGDLIHAVQANGALLLVALGAVVLGFLVLQDLKRKRRAQRDIEDAYGLPRPPQR